MTTRRHTGTVIALVNNKGGVGKTTRTPISSSWLLYRLALLSLVLLAVLATWAQAGEDAAAAVIVPDGGRVVQEGQRLDIYDARSNRTGYGTVRSDGSVDVFNTDGTRRATIQQRPGGGVRVTTPGKW